MGRRRPEKFGSCTRLLPILRLCQTEVRHRVTPVFRSRVPNLITPRYPLSPLPMFGPITFTFPHMFGFLLSSFHHHRCLLPARTQSISTILPLLNRLRLRLAQILPTGLGVMTTS